MILILERIDRGQWSEASSEMAMIEIDAIADPDRRSRVQLLLPEEKSILELTRNVWDRAAELEGLGFKPADAVHVAAAEQAGADVLLSCDDRLCRRARRCRGKLRVRVANPLDWLKEVDSASNS